MEEIKWILTIVYLIWLAICDWKKRKVPMMSLVIGLIGAVIMVVIECVTNQKGIAEPCLGMLPSIFLLVLAWLTGKVGYGDGIVLMIIGILYGYGETVFLLCMSIMLLALVSAFLLVLKKARRNTLMPYIPFLAVTFLLCGGMR